MREAFGQGLCVENDMKKLTKVSRLDGERSSLLGVFREEEAALRHKIAQGGCGHYWTLARI